jgi:pyrroline-5-carboxylate reductase
MRAATIAFLGGGNMAKSIIAGLISDGYRADKIWVADRNASKCTALEQQFQIHTTEDVSHACRRADIVVLAVKPQSMESLSHQVGKHIAQHKPLVISIAAGIMTQDLEAWFGRNTPIVRAMPNTPAVVRVGATGLYANEHTSKDQLSLAEQILRAIGIVTWVKDEALIDVVAALAGSGPAYYFLIMEIMQQVGEDMGLSSKDAHLLTLQTALGAAKLAYESSEELRTLRQQVTSKGGTTEAALNAFEAEGIRAMFRNAMEANRARSVALAEELGVNRKLKQS